MPGLTPLNFHISQMPLYCGTGYQQNYVFASPYPTLNVIFELTFNCMFVLFCAIFVVVVVVVVLFICFVFCFVCVGKPLILALFATGGSFGLAHVQIDIQKNKELYRL